MYVIATLNRKSIDFVNYINSAGLTGKESFNIALSYVLSRNLSLPTGEVTDIDQYYRMQHEHNVFHCLGVVNELLALNDEVIRQYCRAFYALRYNAAYPVAIPLALREEGGIADFFSISKFFSDDALCTIEKCGQDITRMVNGFTELMEDAIKQNQERANQIAGVEDRHVAA